MGVIAGFIGLATAIACFVPGVIISPVTPHEYNPFFVIPQGIFAVSLFCFQKAHNTMVEEVFSQVASQLGSQGWQ